MATIVSADSQNIRAHLLSNETGDAKIMVYKVFPGVEVAYISVHMDYFDFLELEKEHERCIRFHYCKEGRIEQETEDDFFYLMPGDCSVVMQDRPIHHFYLPMKLYHGLSIGFDTNASFDYFKDFFCKGLTPNDVAKHICTERGSVILRSEASVERVFNDMYHAKEEQRIDYLKIKLLELLYFLNNREPTSLGFEDITVSRTQVAFVKRVAEYITLNINEKISMKELALKFGASDTYIQNSFRLVYGMPAISFVRAQKMQTAAQVLIHTDRSIDEIASEFGYENESKFSSAFKKIMGVSPSAYRKEHTKIKIL